MYVIFGEGAITERKAGRWFSRFKKRNFDLSAHDHNTWTKTLNTITHHDPGQTATEPGNIMGYDHSIIVRYPKSMSKFEKLRVLISFEG